MSDITLVIGNKNYSSWSLRPWVLLRHLQLPFDELLIPLSLPDTQARIAQYGPSGRVPVLKHGELTLWESIAIGEYLCELTGNGWPRERALQCVVKVLAQTRYRQNTVVGFRLLHDFVLSEIRFNRQRFELTMKAG